MRLRGLYKFAVTVVLTLALVATSYVAAMATGGSQSYAEAKNTSIISWVTAKDVFMDTFPQLTSIKYLRLTTDHGVKVYEGKACKSNYVYSIEINARSGNVIEVDKNYEGSKYGASAVGAVSKRTIQEKITSRVPGATIIYVKLIREDNAYVYKAEAYHNGYEYEFEFSKRGRLLEYDKEIV